MVCVVGGVGHGMDLVIGDVHLVCGFYGFCVWFMFVYLVLWLLATASLGRWN